MNFFTQSNFIQNFIFWKYLKVGEYEKNGGSDLFSQEIFAKSLETDEFLIVSELYAHKGYYCRSLQSG